MLDPNSSPKVTEVLFLISDLPVEWNGNQYRCRLAFEVGWNEPGLGLKMPWAEFIAGIGTEGGRLEDRDGEYILWWETYGSAHTLGSTLRLYSSDQFAKNDLVKIASSVQAGLLSEPGTLVFCPSWVAENVGTPLPAMQEDGVLVQDSNGFLRLDDGELLIFPAGIYAQKKYGAVNVYNGDHVIIAKVGDKITTAGSLVSRDAAELYIGSPLPGNCQGPYRIVSSIT